MEVFQGPIFLTAQWKQLTLWIIPNAEDLPFCAQRSSTSLILKKSFVSISSDITKGWYPELFTLFLIVDNNYLAFTQVFLIGRIETDAS